MPAAMRSNLRAIGVIAQAELTKIHRQRIPELRADRRSKQGSDRRRLR